MNTSLLSLLFKEVSSAKRNYEKTLGDIRGEREWEGCSHREVFLRTCAVSRIVYFNNDFEEVTNDTINMVD